MSRAERRVVNAGAGPDKDLVGLRARGRVVRPLLCRVIDRRWLGCQRSRRRYLGEERLMRVIVSAAAAYLLAGCSFLAVSAPASERRAGAEPSCKVSHGSVVVDGLVALTSLAVAVSSDDGGAVAGGLIGALYGGSVIYGVRGNRRCEVARMDYQEELAVQAERDEQRERERRAERVPMVPKPTPPRLVKPVTPPGLAPPVTPPRPVPPPVAVSAAVDDDDDDADSAPAADDAPAEETLGIGDPFAPQAPVRPVPAKAPPRPDDLEARWREFWRRLP